MRPLDSFVAAAWADAEPTLCDFIRIPNKSPAFDPAWEEHGHMERAVELVAGWLGAHAVEGMTLEVHRLPGRTPVILVEVPATAPGAATDADTATDTGAGTVLLYGHLDKQPEMVGWRDGLGPWEPVLEDGRLYGRGGADDGYAAFAALTAVRALGETGRAHARCVILIEASEESGSPDLPAHVEALAGRIGPVDLVVCLDSGCESYDRLWLTTSLRGLVGLDVRVDVLGEGIHSGASGVVPSSFRVLRHLLDRIEDSATGRILLAECQVPIPEERRRQAEVVGELLGPEGVAPYPFAGSTRPVVADPAQMILARSWAPALSVTGLEGAPPLADAGNVLRPYTAARLSLRLPPGCDPERAADAVVAALTADPPHGAVVTVTGRETAWGWDAPPTAPWLEQALADASRAAFGGQAPAASGLGGSIPFMAMLGERFPAAQFVVTGVLGPGSNAHGPNEFLDLGMARGVTACVADVLAAHAVRGA